MATFLKYFGMFCLGIIAASLAATAVIIYQGINGIARYTQGINDYTCHQFLYDMTQPGTDKMLPVLFATVAYGESTTRDTAINTLSEQGVEPTVRKAAALCEANPKQKLLDAFAATIVKPAAAVSPSGVVSPTTGQ